MIVDLDDKAFKQAEQDDILVIKVENRKKVATPKPKEELLKTELNRLEKAEKEIFDLKEIIKKQEKEMKKFRKEMNLLLVQITEIVGGVISE